MPARVKICGLKTDEAMQAALDAGADLVGLVFHAKSPRNVSIATAKQLAERARGKAEIVALVVDPTDETLRAIVDVIRPDIIQLHGNETPDRWAAAVAEHEEMMVALNARNGEGLAEVLGRHLDKTLVRVRDAIV